MQGKYDLVQQVWVKSNSYLRLFCDFLAYLLGRLKEESENSRSFVSRMAKFNGAFENFCNVFGPNSILYLLLPA